LPRQVQDASVDYPNVISVGQGSLTGMGAGASGFTGTEPSITYFYDQIDTLCTENDGQSSTIGNATVQPWVQISSTALNPTSITTTSTSTLTVQIAHTDLSSIANPTVTLEIITLSSDPAGISLSYTNPGPTVTVDLTQPSPISKTFTVSFASGTVPGTAVIHASLTHQSSNAFIVKDPSSPDKAQKPLTIN